MKTISKVTLLLALTLALSLFACKDEPPAEEQPQDWTDVTIDGISGLKISTVSGTQLTPTQMNTIKSRLKTAIEGVQGGSDAVAKLNLNNILSSPTGLVIELETTTEYTQYKKVGTGLRLNVNHALTALNGTTFGNAVGAIYGDAPTQQ